MRKVPPSTWSEEIEQLFQGGIDPGTNQSRTPPTAEDAHERYDCPAQRLKTTTTRRPRRPLLKDPG